MFSVLSRPGAAGVCLVALTLGLALARDASAHIDLDQPPPREVGSSREPNSDLKQGPCGQVEDGRTDRVSVFAPGETIEVTWTETINHRSYYRIAFDRDGDDAFPTFAGPGIGAQGIDPRGLCPVDGQVILAYELEDGARGAHTLRVTLPDVECERCTLQVVQYMLDANNPYYFQCADLALRRPASGDAGPTESLDASLIDASTGVEPRAAPGCSARIAPLDAGTRGRGRDDEDEPPPAPSTPPRPAAEQSPNAPPPASVEPAAPAASRRSGGCALDPSRRSSNGGAWALLLGLLAMRCRTRARGSASRARR